MALEALSNVIKHNRGVDIQCIGHFKLLFSLLRLGRCPKIQVGQILQIHAYPRHPRMHPEENITQYSHVS